jgi:plasmid stabilization system protein ParE
MTKPIRVDAAAKAELRAAARWYEQQREDLGHELIAAVDEAVARVARLGPDCRPVYGVDPELSVRRLRTKQSPYAVAFIESPERSVSLP